MASRRVPVGELAFGEELGRGSFGTVRVATWGAPGRGQVAVKVIHRHRINSVQMDGFMRALQLELSLAPHPNICRLHGWACDAPSAVLAVVMELCSSGSLAAELKSGRTRAWSAARMLRSSP